MFCYFSVQSDREYPTNIAWIHNGKQNIDLNYDKRDQDFPREEYSGAAPLYIYPLPFDVVNGMYKEC